MTDDGFSLSWNGQHYDAKFDGNPVPLEGDATHLMVTVKNSARTRPTPARHSRRGT
jgi:hypothetical protein